MGHYLFAEHREAILMKLYEYIADAISGQVEKQDIFGAYKVKKNKSGTNTLITKPSGEKYMIVDLNKLRGCLPQRD